MPRLPAQACRTGAARVLAGLLLLCASAAVQALTVQVLGVSAGSEEFLQTLQAELGDAHTVTAAPAADADLVVALHEGVLAPARALKKPLLLLLPAPGSETLHADETALYWAPSLSDQLRLALQIMPGLRRIGLVAGAQDMERAQALRQAAGNRRLDFIVREGDPARLARQVAEVAATADIFLAPVDARLYSRDNLKPVLLAAYRQRRVFIGPNPSYVRAGALASLHATPQTLAADSASAIRFFLSNRSWPSPFPASRFEVITNPQVARSLGLRLPDAAALTRVMQSEKVVVWP
jgi:hypothetical protein